MRVVKIVVCVKHVADAETEVEFRDNRVVRSDYYKMNELDEPAIEQAVSLVEEHGGEVVAVSMGSEDDDSEDTLMRALQMGANRAVMISDESLENADVVVTAQVLGAAIRYIGASEAIDLVLTGMASADGMTSMLPSALATVLTYPLAGNANALEVGSGRAAVERSIAGVNERVQVELPAVISVTDQINEPRFPNFKDLRAARQKPFDTISVDDLADFLPENWSGAPRVRVLQAQPHERSQDRQILQDSGNGGQKLAEYLAGQLK